MKGHDDELLQIIFSLTNFTREETFCLAKIGEKIIFEEKKLKFLNIGNLLHFDVFCVFKSSAEFQD